MESDLQELLDKRHQLAREHKETGGLVMGCYPALLPEELLWACGVLPMQLLTSGQRFPLAEEHLPANACECSKSMLQQALDESLAYLDGVLLAHVCETLRGMGGILAAQRPELWVRFFSPPRYDDQGARDFLKDELRQMAAELAARGARPLEEENLAEAIALFNENRRLVKRLYELRAASPRAISSEQVIAHVLASTVLPKPAANQALTRLIDGHRPQNGDGFTAVALVGLNFETELAEGQGVPSLLRSAGAEVVWDDLASGMRYRSQEVVSGQGQSPLDALVESLLGPQPCSLRKTAEAKVNEILAAVSQYRARGVVLLVPKFCDPFLFDVTPLSGMLRQKGIPSLALETSGQGSSGQLKVRVEAFVEMLRAEDADYLT